MRLQGLGDFLDVEQRVVDQIEHVLVRKPVHEVFVDKDVQQVLGAHVVEDEHLLTARGDQVEFPS